MKVSMKGGTYGDQRHAIRAGPFVVSETEHPPHFHLARHSHERASLNIVLSGIYRESFAGEGAAYAPLTMIAKPGGEAHANQFGERGARCLIEVDEPSALGPFTDLFEKPASLVSPFGLRLVADLGRELRSPDIFTCLSIQALVTELLIDHSRRESRVYKQERPWVTRCAEILRAARGKRITLGSLGKAVGVHPVHLARTFKKEIGFTVAQYARRLRLEYAMDLLQHSDLMMVQIALEAGYCDQSHMARDVRRETGLSPSSLQRQVRCP